MVQPVGILGTGSYLPKKVVDNVQVADRAQTTPEWIERKTHIRQRRCAAPDEATSDLAVQAATRALHGAGVSPGDIDFLVLASSTPDSPQPPTSHLVQHALGAYGAACLDINVVCSGFVYGLAVADGLIATRGRDTRALVIGADVYSRIVDTTDRRTAAVLGDGAGAAVLGAVSAPAGLLGSELRSCGDAHALIGVAAGGSRMPATAETVRDGLHLFRMSGRGVRDFVLEQVPPALAALSARTGVPLDEVQHFVPHQPNGVLLDELVSASGLSDARTHRVLEHYGNTGCSSVAIALDAANSAGDLHDGDLVLLAGFGGGMSIGAALLRWAAA